VVPQYVDIATDINLLIDYAKNEMWGYFILTLIFILMPSLVVVIVTFDFFFEFFTLKDDIARSGILVFLFSFMWGPLVLFIS
jgi:hypothetical protein